VRSRECRETGKCAEWGVGEREAWEVWEVWGDGAEINSFSILYSTLYSTF